MSESLATILAPLCRIVESPGIAAALLDRAGRRSFTATGLARQHDNAPMQSGMAFPAGSIIKPCLGMLALQLAAEGALSLDDRLQRWLPEFSGSADLRAEPSAASPATLRQVLNHSAGIKCFTELLYWLPYELQVRNAQRPWGDADALAIANHFPPYFAAGTGFHYSNCGYALLGLALERAASTAAGRHIDMDTLLRTRVFEPAGLLATRYIRHDPPRPNTQARSDTSWPELEMRGYMKPEHGGHDVTEFETYGLYGPAGAMLSTLADLLQLSQALWTGTYAATLLDSIPAGGPGKSYGMGVQIFDRDWAGGRFVGHGGNVMGVSSGMWFFPERGLHLAFVANRALVWERPIFEALLAWADRPAR